MYHSLFVYWCRFYLTCILIYLFVGTAHIHQHLNV